MSNLIIVRRVFYLRAKYSLAVICQTSEEGDDAPRTLRVKTRCRFVKEE